MANLKRHNEVYLDHLIQRENLRYTRPKTKFSERTAAKRDKLQLRDLTLDARDKQKLRKPDFQRATWAWTPEDCVSLLDSVVKTQVVPSIIMWSSPNGGYDYILDGGHRVSVVMAWLANDWGYEFAKNFDDPEIRRSIQTAAQNVATLVSAQIGTIEEYEKAARLLDEVLAEGTETPKAVLGDKLFQRGYFYSELEKGSIAFDILWVGGNYETAEQSFLKINKSGKILTDWETKLIENRNSSFARSVMSIATDTSSSYYWPQEQISGLSTTENEQIQQNVETIKDQVSQIQVRLFTPDYQRPIRRLEQPLLVAEAEKKPYYVAEFLTITEGYRGQPAETEALLKSDKDGAPAEIVKTGYKILSNAMSALDHLIGNSPKSLEVVPALYFYSPDGRHIRSLLYGFLYWLTKGSEKDVINRKIAFSAYRGQFELILMRDKNEIIQRIGRKVGSGTEVTEQTALYFHNLVNLLVKHSGKQIIF